MRLYRKRSEPVKGIELNPGILQEKYRVPDEENFKMKLHTSMSFFRTKMKEEFDLTICLFIN